MIRDIVTIDVTKKHYKKMGNYLRSLKITSEMIAISVNEINSKYCPINWKDILPHDHRVKKIILLKRDNLFLYIGFSSDNKTIVYNDAFSEFILINSTLINNMDLLPSKSKVSQKNNDKKINALLDKIAFSGIESLTYEERNSLNNLSKFLK